MNDVPTPGDALNQFLAERQMPLLNPDLTSRFNNIVSPDVTLAAVGLAERWLAHATTQIKGAARTRERTAAGFYDKNIYLDGYSEPASLDEATPEQMRRLVAHKRSVKLHEAASMEDMGPEENGRGLPAGERDAQRGRSRASTSRNPATARSHR